MIRLTLHVVMVVLAVSSSIWMANHPGKVTLAWYGWYLDTNIPVLLLFLLFTICIAVLFFYWSNFLRTIIPSRIFKWRMENKSRRYHNIISIGFLAVAAGDNAKARSVASQIDHFEERKRNDSILLLQAKIAELLGNKVSAKKYYNILYDNPTTKLIGLRGLIHEALREEDYKKVLSLSKIATALRPTRWSVHALFRALIHEKNWTEAASILSDHSVVASFNEDEVNHYQAILDTQRAIEANVSGDHGKALRLVKRALDKEPDITPAAALAARLYVAAGKRRVAARIIEAAWRYTPHRELAITYLAIWPGENNLLKRKQQAALLASCNPHHPESYLIIAETAIEAQLWDQARSKIAASELASDRDGTIVQRSAALMARLEQEEHNDIATANSWLGKAVLSSMEKQWQCCACGRGVTQWHAICTYCGSFASLS